MHIVWDEPKRMANLSARQLDFAELDVEFFADAVVIPAKLGRYKAIGWFDDAPTTVIFKPLGSEAVSVISFRRASQKERRLL
jgi:uncharacterized DUF497 family protein